jgi:hypothetical protein
MCPSHDLAEVDIREESFEQVCVAQVCAVQACAAQVCTAQFCEAEVWNDALVFGTPRVPRSNPLLESRDIVVVGHGPAPSFDPIVLAMGAQRNGLNQSLVVTLAWREVAAFA